MEGQCKHIRELMLVHSFVPIILCGEPLMTPRKRHICGRIFLLYRKSSSLPLPLLEGITMIGYWTRSSVARARLSIGDRFTPEKPLLDATTQNTATLTFALYSAVSLVLAFHWRQIYPSLGCHQDAYDRKILLHPQDCHRGIIVESWTSTLYL